jgi:hypothetical protein
MSPCALPPVRADSSGRPHAPPARTPCYNRSACSLQRAAGTEATSKLNATRPPVSFRKLLKSSMMISLRLTGKASSSG